MEQNAKRKNFFSFTICSYDYFILSDCKTILHLYTPVHKMLKKTCLFHDDVYMIILFFQIVKILNLYTPVDEFEERVPISFIRKLQQHLKNRPNQESHLLMDLKFSFSVTFPFNPSNISLESVEIPDSLHLTGVTKL